MRQVQTKLQAYTRYERYAPRRYGPDKVEILRQVNVVDRIEPDPRRDWPFAKRVRLASVKSKGELKDALFGFVKKLELDPKDVKWDNKCGEVAV